MWKWLALAALSASPDRVDFGLSTGDSGRAPPPRPGPDVVLCGPRARPLERRCTADADCVIVQQTLSCCGTVTIKGINRSDLTRAEEQQRVCGTPRRCGCAPAPTRLDDGADLERGGRAAVACRVSVCFTYLEVSKLTSAVVRSLPRCDDAACGPAPLYPTGTCADGTSEFGRGPCVRRDGRCGWAHLECP